MYVWSGGGVEGDTRKLAEMGLTRDRINGPWDGVNNQRQSSNRDIVNSNSSSRLGIEN